jgi:hypothetical protein
LSHCEATEEANGQVRSPKYAEVGNSHKRWQCWSVVAEEKVEKGGAELTDSCWKKPGKTESQCSEMNKRKLTVLPIRKMTLRS